MAIKKTELYSSLWAGCDELRGGMDASQYKDYVLTLLFMKYVSDKYKGDPYGMIVVPQGASFDDMVALKGDKEIGEKLNMIISALAEENDLKGVIDVADFNDEDKLGKGKDMIDRLSKLVGIFEGIDLSANRADGDDLLGDAYEYLMRHFATESGKSKGQFYTPAEVSRILAKVIGISQDTPQDASVYDPRFIETSSEAYGTHMPRSDWKIVKEFELALPSIEEQTTIATILSDMDADIQTLQQRLSKTRQIKQGMMQQLLTGKIRLIKPEPSISTKCEQGVCP